MNQQLFKKITAGVLLTLTVAGRGLAQSCATCGTANTLPGNTVGPSLRVSLGKAQYGQPAGDLVFASAVPSATLYSPAALSFTASRPDVTVVTNLDGSIRQVNAPQALADIPVPSSTNGYVINFYFASQVSGPVSGIYGTTGSPYMTWAITNTNSATINQVQVSKISASDGLLNQWNYAYSTNTQVWTEQQGNGLVQYTTTVTNINTLSNQIITTIGSPSGALARQIKTTYQSNSWGPSVSRVDVGSASAPETALYTYSDPSPFGASSPPPVIFAVNPDGSWVYYYSYDSQGDPTAVYSSSGDIPTNEWYLGRETVYSYGSGYGDDGTINPRIPRLASVYVDYTEIYREFTLFPSASERLDIQCTVPSADWDDSGNLVTTTHFYTSGPNQYAVQSVFRPDGTMTAYYYATNSAGTQLTNTVVTGAPDPTSSFVVDGVSNVTVLNTAGFLISVSSYDVKSGITLLQDNYSDSDSYGRPQEVTHLDGTTEQTYYACCGLDHTVDRDGTTTQYYYDAAKRQTAYSRNGITYSNVLDPAGDITATIRIGSDDQSIITGQTEYDLAGEVIAQTNALGGVTTHSRTNDATTGGLDLVTVNPDGGSITNFYYLDGTIKETIGTATPGMAVACGPATDANGNQCMSTTETDLNTDGSSSSQWTTTYADMVGRNTETLYAAVSGSPASLSYYNSSGQLWKQTDPDGVATLYQYNPKGECVLTAIDLNQNNTIDLSGPDRITFTTNDVYYDSANAANVNRTRTYVWEGATSSASNIISTMETSVDGLNSWATTWNGSTAITSKNHTVYGSGGNRYVTATAADGSYTTSTFSYGLLESVVRSLASGSQLSSTSFGYDTQGRQNTLTDARNGTTTTMFNSADMPISVTTPPAGNGQGSQTAMTYYDTSLRTTNVVYPDNTSVATVYYPTGDTALTYGSRQYPVGYGYDAQGRMTTMTNWSAFPSAGARVTTLNYDAYRGWLNSKRYPDTTGPDYTYTAGGRLSTREWARTGTGSQRILTTYTYGFQDGSGTNGVGDLIGVVYSHDPVSTPSLSYVYDRLGRRITATQGGMTTTLSYDDASDFLGESYSGGVLDGFSVSSGYDSIDRRTSLTASGSSALLTNTFGYDSASELTSVSYGPFSANYSYVANSPLVGQIVCQSNSTVQLTTTKQYDNLDRLWSIVSMPGASGQWPISYVYQYNQANQRTQASQYDNSFWKYDYDALGQVISGEKHWSDNTHVPGEQFQYAFDDIGNRTSTESGGDQNGNNLRSATYSVNNLNQYTSRTVPNGFDMLGQVNVGATVWVNGSVSDYRRGEFFQKGLTVTNSSQAAWLPVTVGASNGATTNFVAGHEFVVETPENYTYDADGNLTQDGRWNYTWDAENRLIEMASLSGAPSGSQYKLDFSYDYQGRRIQKLVSTNNGTWVASYTNRFLYDGWNLIAILNPDGSTAESFVWGSDLAGSAGLPRQSAATAGGVGGLLAVKVSNGANAGTYFYAFDGNGNVAGLVSAGNGTVSAEYEYGPFGELIRATGPMAKLNPFRWSTKYQDDETDLVYYGRRYLKTSTGGWLSRDPIDELGSMLMTEDAVDDDGDSENDGNLYRFVNNDPISQTDALGLWPSSSPFLGFLINGHAIPLTHQNANQASLPISSGDLIMVNAATKFVDTFQKTQDSYMHAMKAPNQDGGVAKQLANDFVKKYLIQAETELCGCSGNRNDALFDFGMALHTVQDSTSPAHNTPQNEFKTWDGTIHWIKALRHVKHEDFDPGPGSALYRATADFWKYFQCINSAPPLPDNFFTWGTDQNPKGK